MEITKQTSTQDIHTKKRKESKHNAKDMVKSKRQRKEQKKAVCKLQIDWIPKSHISQWLRTPDAWFSSEQQKLNSFTYSFQQLFIECILSHSAKYC